MSAHLDHLRRSRLNFFVPRGIDRVAHRRADGDWVLDRLAEPETRIVPVWRSRHPWDPAAGAGETSAVLLSPREIGDIAMLTECVVLLGESGGGYYFALDLPPHEAVLSDLFAPRTEYLELRELGPWLGGREGALLAYARAMVFWHARHRFCGACGAPTRSLDAGHMRECTSETCGARHFPRTDPAVIVLVSHGAPGAEEERCLLGRQPVWPPGLYSTVAGFVEPGESLENAVVREVEEETGVHVHDVRYHSSQPWPFPSSIMLGFTARAETLEIRRNDDELEDARWLTRDEMIRELAAGAFKVPRRVSIAYRLVEDWFDAGNRGRLAEHLP